MNERVGLKIIDLIHDITRYEFEVRFSADFEGMLKIYYTAQYGTWSDHEHLGHPGCERKVLEKEIIKSLSNFLESLKNGSIKHE